LALALGLADVAAAQRGGIQVEALFIDEGFGTLDTETLDRAVGVLTDLESEHKMIGIISHVTELRERVPARLEVVKTNQGSRLVVHLPQA
jgi:exonuclease SbcC